jgi:hypothetical protein
VNKGSYVFLIAYWLAAIEAERPEMLQLPERVACVALAQTSLA